MPLPRNQCGDVPLFGFEPLRKKRPESAFGIAPVTGRSVTVSSSKTGAKLPRRWKGSANSDVAMGYLLGWRITYRE